jgi:arylsulfatase
MERTAINRESISKHEKEQDMATKGKPNILFIMSDDIGWFNISCNNNGIMGYRTPNIDRLAKEGANFTDFYGQQSCTAGRAAFITGQSPIRTGLTKVGMPGATLGLKAEDPTIAQFLKNLGYATGQFGKNHLGDRNEHLPTVHGFDEFFGNLYHLTARRSRSTQTIPKIRSSERSSDRVVCSGAKRPTQTIRQPTRCSARSASRPSRTRGR